LFGHKRDCVGRNHFCAIFAHNPPDARTNVALPLGHYAQRDERKR
jgi:hypothetical protein